MKKDKIILMITVIAVALTMILSLPYCAVAQESKKSSIADSAYERGYLVNVGNQAPDNFELILHDGSKTSLKQLGGKVVVLQFTASWCSVCRIEMPHLEADVWKAYKDKNFVLIGVDRDEPLQTVQKFHADMHITYPLALDPKAEIFGRFADKKSGVTRNVVIDPNGKIVFLTRLYDENEFSQMVKVIKKLVITSNKASL